MQLQTDRLQGMQRARKGMLHHTKRIYKEYGIRVSGYGKTIKAILMMTGFLAWECSSGMALCFL